MKITKRQLRRIIREAGDRYAEKPRPYDSAQAKAVAEVDYKEGYAAGRGGMALSPYANDDYAAGYEDGVVTSRIRALKEAYDPAIDQDIQFEWSRDGLTMFMMVDGQTAAQFSTQKEVQNLIIQLEGLLAGPMRASP